MFVAYLRIAASLVLMVTPSFFCLPADAKTERGKGHVLPAEAQYDTGMAKFKQKDYDGAIDGFKQAIYFARNEYFPQAYYWLGCAHQLKNEDTKAIEAFKKFLEQTVSSSWEAHIHLGEIYLRNKRFVEAEDQAREALAGFQGPCPQAYNLYGKVYRDQDKYDSAVHWFLQALGDTPWTYTEAWLNYANMLMMNKKWQNAIYQYTAMLKSDKPLKGLDFETVYLNRGTCLMALGDHQNALEDWHRTLSLNQSNTEAHLQLAMMFDAERHVSSAVKEYKEFTRLCTEAPRVSAVKQRIQMLELQLKPKEAEPTAPASSPYVRKMQEEAQKEEERKMLQPGDSGF